VSARALGTLALAAGLTAAFAACHRSAAQDKPSTASATPSAAPVPASSMPIDHLAPGELVEGGQQAFGLTLPRDVRIEQAFADVVYARGRVPVHALVQYFHARLQEGGMREGERSASFDHVKVRGKPGLELAIHIMDEPGGTRVEIRDTTPPPAPGLPDEASRWKQVGLTPDGRLADPTHLD
jgi:hypothetical protein